MFESHEITAGFDTLMRQSHQTAQLYLAQARIDIDAEFGDSYAKLNPALVAAYMNVAIQDFKGSMQFLAAQLDRSSRQIED